MILRIKSGQLRLLSSFPFLLLCTPQAQRCYNKGKWKFLLCSVGEFSDGGRFGTSFAWEHSLAGKGSHSWIKIMVDQVRLEFDRNLKVVSLQARSRNRDVQCSLCNRFALLLFPLQNSSVSLWKSSKFVVSWMKLLWSQLNHDSSLEDFHDETWSFFNDFSPSKNSFWLNQPLQNKTRNRSRLSATKNRQKVPETNSKVRKQWDGRRNGFEERYIVQYVKVAFVLMDSKTNSLFSSFGKDSRWVSGCSEDVRAEQRRIAWWKSLRGQWTTRCKEEKAIDSAKAGNSNDLHWKFVSIWSLTVAWKRRRIT
jgi:hypothetical protein